jgi:DTW domain-containing protein YfiP
MITKPLPPPVRRPVCDSCRRPARACICKWTRPITAGVEVVILQHPLEASHPKGSARLLHMSLPGSRLVIGESFTKEELRALLYQPLYARSQHGEEATARQPVLLYPKTEEGAPASMQEPQSLDPSRVRLIVLDGTWRKSRKMLHVHPLLNHLPRLALDAPPPSRYRIRQAYRSHQLSTLEAVSHALARLENDEDKYQPLLAAFDSFIEAQQRWLPGERKKEQGSED